MCNRYRESGVDSPFFLTRAVMLLGYISLLILFCGTFGSASSSKDRGEGISCRQRYKALGTELQVGDINTEGYDEMPPHTASVYRTDGEPVLYERILQGLHKRTRKSTGESSHHNVMSYDSNEGDILKSIILHLIKYPRRLNRAEAKSENYNLRANYIPRLGRKRSYPGKK
ncbi:unnamed protein product [Larinioides sclopetarius]|uniref:Uncharacterized protein n=1 Tax=Larinioides sclopetarius TaxID=280406 RepID=A0AAV1Z6A9_9ARAC